MKEDPSISIITTVYNAQSTVEESIRSIQAQVWKDFEYIIIDDGSSDNSPAVIKSIEDSRIVFIEEKHLGRVKALNRGLEYAKGEYVAILDADDIAYPNRLLIQKEFLDSHPEIAIVASNADLIDLKGNRIGITRFPDDHQSLYNCLVSLVVFPHSSVMYRRKAVMQFGGYNELCEKSVDYNLYLELLIQKEKMHCIESPLIRLRSYATSWGKQDSQEIQLRYAILGLINFYQIQQGVPGILDSSLADWQKILNTFNLWFERKAFHTKINAKKILHQARDCFSKKQYFRVLPYLLKATIQDPLFWQYRGCGFKYPKDITDFLNTVNQQ